MLLEHRESRSAPKKVLKARVCDVCFNIERRQERAAASLRAAEDAAEDAAEVGGASGSDGSQARLAVCTSRSLRTKPALHMWTD